MKWWEKILLKAYKRYYLNRKSPIKDAEILRMNPKTIEDFLTENPERAYKYITDMNQQATERYNDAISDRRNVYMSIFMTSGTFLTVALPLLSTNESIFKSLIFKFIVIDLLLSLLLGIWASLREGAHEITDHNRIFNQTSAAALYLRNGETEKAIELVKEFTDDFKRFGNDLELIKKDITLKSRRLALIMFFIGITSFAAWMLYR